MAKTYRQKMEELRLKSLKILEEGLSHSDPSVQLLNAVFFMSSQPNDVMNSQMPEEPDALDAETIIEKGENL